MAEAGGEAGVVAAALISSETTSFCAEPACFHTSQRTEVDAAKLPMTTAVKMSQDPGTLVLEQPSSHNKEVETGGA